VKVTGGRTLLLCLALAACRKAPAPEAVKGAPAQLTPRADEALKQAVKEEKDEDASWLMGMWKEDGKAAWLLFNPPAEVAELVGQPVKVTRRGKLRVHGKYVALIFEAQELHFEASSDHGELASDDIRHVYRRGAPPP
jgi:hypothetical protein